MRTPALALALVAALALAGCMTDREAPSTPSAATAAPSAAPTAASSAGSCVSTKSDAAAKEPVVTLSTTQGDIRLKLFCDKAPVTAQHIAKLVEAGCYDGTKFHRVVRGFMDQGGDPLSKDDAQSARWGTGGPADCGQEPDTIKEEFYCADGTIQNDPSGSSCASHGGLVLKHDKPGVWSMARTAAPATSGSQFFLTAAPAAFLDGKYTVFGQTADQASTDVVVKINNLPCRGQPCQDPNSRTDTLVVVTTATIAWA